jgi:hypothetical protein
MAASRKVDDGDRVVVLSTFVLAAMMTIAW